MKYTRKIIKIATSFLVIFMTAFSYIPTKVLADDTNPPILTKLSFTFDEVDTTTTPQAITVTATISDETDGIGDFNITFKAPDGSTRTGSTCNIPNATAATVPIIVNGTGTCITLVKFDQNIPSGTWIVEEVHLFDSFGHETTIFYEDLVAAGFSSTIEVTSN